MTIALVTGASRGIGRAIALRLARDGMEVAVNDLAAQQDELEVTKLMIEKEGRKSFSVTADISSESEVNAMIEKVVEHFGELNVMISNAGIVSTKSLFEVSVEEWDRVQSVNVRGMFLCHRAAARQFIKQGKGGKIVGACSIAGYKGSPDALAYSVSKWGVRGLTQGCAQELAPHGINVNAVCPGPVATHMWEELDEARGVSKGMQKWEAFHKSVEARSAMKKASTVEDIADAYSFLAGPHSKMITGQSIIVDGGILFS